MMFLVNRILERTDPFSIQPTVEVTNMLGRHLSSSSENIATEQSDKVDPCHEKATRVHLIEKATTSALTKIRFLEISLLTLINVNAIVYLTAYISG
jgi:hypothetical protein